MWMSAINMGTTPAVEIPSLGVFADVQTEFAQVQAAQSELARMQEALGIIGSDGFADSIGSLGTIGTRTNIFTDFNTDNEVSHCPAVQ